MTCEEEEKRRILKKGVITLSTLHFKNLLLKQMCEGRQQLQSRSPTMFRSFGSSSPRLYLLLLLFLPPPSSACHISGFTECQQAPFVPGHNLAGEGYNVVTMKPSGASVVDVKNYMVGGQQGNCTVCLNRLLNQTQKLPVSVLDWRIKVRCKQSLSSKIFQSSQSVMKEQSDSLSASWKVGLKIGSLVNIAVGGSHSKSSKFAESHSKSDKFSFTTHDLNCEYYTFRLHSRPPLSQEFHDSLKDLPSTFHHKNTSAFRQFIATYGTHFIRRVHLGGKIHSMTAIKTCQASMQKISVHTVSNCLSVEASAGIKGFSVSAESKFCKDKSKSLKTGASFSQAFSDRTIEVMGGDGDIADILFKPNSAAGYKKWLRSLKSVPGVVSFQLSPLHLLIRDNPILKETLREAVSDYIRTSAKPLSCKSGCKVGRQNRNCACRCQGHRMVNADCCPGAPGVARMRVTVQRAAGLWGDYFSKTDGYVKVFYGKGGATTPIIWNNNFPAWNYVIRFGTVNLNSRTQLKIEVWDRDNGWNDDLLGRVHHLPTAGTTNKVFGLKHGSIYIQVSATCAPSLQGALCEQYLATPSYQEVMGQVQEQQDSWDSSDSGYPGPEVVNTSQL